MIKIDSKFIRNLNVITDYTFYIIVLYVGTLSYNIFILYLGINYILPFR